MRTKQHKFNEPTMNYNIRVPQSLYQQVKEIALKEHKSISLWINEALEKVINENIKIGEQQ